MTQEQNKTLDVAKSFLTSIIAKVQPKADPKDPSAGYGYLSAAYAILLSILNRMKYEEESTVLNAEATAEICKTMMGTKPEDSMFYTQFKAAADAGDTKALGLDYQAYGNFANAGVAGISGATMGTSEANSNSKIQSLNAQIGDTDNLEAAIRTPNEACNKVDLSGGVEQTSEEKIAGTPPAKTALQRAFASVSDGDDATIEAQMKAMKNGDVHEYQTGQKLNGQESAAREKQVRINKEAAAQLSLRGESPKEPDAKGVASVSEKDQALSQTKANKKRLQDDLQTAMSEKQNVIRKIDILAPIFNATATGITTILNAGTQALGAAQEAASAITNTSIQGVADIEAKLKEAAIQMSNAARATAQDEKSLFEGLIQR